MKRLSQAIDRFCILHPRFGVPNLILYIVTANVAVYLFDSFSGAELSKMLYFSLDMAAKGQLWRLATFVLIPDAGNVFALLISCYFYYWIGSALERRWGTAKFTCYYLSGMAFTLLGTVIASLIVGVGIPVYGAGYVNFAMFLAFAAMWPDAQVLLFFIIPIKIKYLAYLDLAFFTWSIVRYLLAGAWYFAVIPVMALLNFVIFFWQELEQLLGMKTVRRPAAHDSGFAAHASPEAQTVNAGLRTCAVCGRTNLTNPELDFRYCSRCAGYHCFCSDHIFSHVHFTEDEP